MNRRLRGFATFAALATMILLTTYLSLNASGLAQNQVELARSTSISGIKSAWSLADAALKSLDTWDASKQRFSGWAGSHSSASITWKSLSARINLNTVTPFILALPAIQASLHGATVEQFTDLRAKQGPSSDLQTYSSMFDKDLLDGWYTVHSTWNVNTADEIMLEAIVGERLQSPATGSAIRALVRGVREQKKQLAKTEWQDKMGPNAEALGTLVNTDPELDVNEMPATLLQALVLNPDWAIDNGATKVQQIMSQRDEKPFDPDALKALLGVPDGHIALAYLGTSTRFVQLDVAVSTGKFSLVVKVGDPGSKIPHRVVSTQWIAQ